jgi:hypothetical protein
MIVGTYCGAGFAGHFDTVAGGQDYRVNPYADKFVLMKYVSMHFGDARATILLINHTY